MKPLGKALGNWLSQGFNILARASNRSVPSGIALHGDEDETTSSVCRKQIESGHYSRLCRFLTPIADFLLGENHFRTAKREEDEGSVRAQSDHTP